MVVVTIFGALRMKSLILHCLLREFCNRRCIISYLREARHIFHYFNLCNMNFSLICIYKASFRFAGDAHYVSVIETCLLVLIMERILTYSMVQSLS